MIYVENNCITSCHQVTLRYLHCDQRKISVCQFNLIFMILIKLVQHYVFVRFRGIPVLLKILGIILMKIEHLKLKNKN